MNCDLSMSALLPQFVLIGGAFLLIALSRVAPNARHGGRLCLFILAVAATCHAWPVQPNGTVDDAAEAVRQDEPGSRLDRDARNMSIVGTTRSLILVDPLATVCQGFGIALGVLFTLAAMEFQRETDCSLNFFAMLLLSLSGFLLVGAANDMILIVLGLEMIGMPCHALLFASRRSLSAQEAAMKHFLLSLLSTALLLYGLSFVYGMTGSTSLHSLNTTMAAGGMSLLSGSASGEVMRLGLLASVLVVSGLAFRLGAVPFHFGTAEIFDGTTAWHAGWLSTIPKAAACVVAVRVLSSVPGWNQETGQLLWLVLATATIVIASALALFETKIRRILAYTTMAHGGLVLIGLAAGYWSTAHPESVAAIGAVSQGGIASALFVLGSGLIAVSGVFAVLVYCARSGEQIEFIDELSGLIRSEPIAAGCAVICLLSLLGIPPLSGFWGHFLVLSSALSVQGLSNGTLVPGTNSGVLWALLLAGSGLLMQAVVYIRLIVAICLNSPAGRARPSGGQSALASAMLAAFALVGIGLMPGPAFLVLDRIESSIRESRQPRADDGLSHYESALHRSDRQAARLAREGQPGPKDVVRRDSLPAGDINAGLDRGRRRP